MVFQTRNLHDVSLSEITHCADSNFTGTCIRNNCCGRHWNGRWRMTHSSLLKFAREENSYDVLLLELPYSCSRSHIKISFWCSRIDYAAFVVTLPSFRPTMSGIWWGYLYEMGSIQLTNQLASYLVNWVLLRRTEYTNWLLNRLIILKFKMTLNFYK